MNVANLIARQNGMNFTNIKMAERLGITAETYSRYRNGHIPLPPDLDMRLSTIEQAHGALHHMPAAKTRVAHWPRFTMDLEFIPPHMCDRGGNPLLPAGTMYWNYEVHDVIGIGLQGYLVRCTRAPKGYNDGNDGLYLPPCWVGITLPNAASEPYAEWLDQALAGDTEFPMLQALPGQAANNTGATWLLTAQILASFYAEVLPAHREPYAWGAQHQLVMHIEK